MSRIAKAPIKTPSNVEVNSTGNVITVKGPKGSLNQDINSAVVLDISDDKVITFKPVIESKPSWALAGTMRSLVNNMIVGVTDGFTKTLELVGVGYRAQVSGSTVTLSLGFSHPVIYNLPKDVQATTPNVTTLVLESRDKQLLGQVAAEIRAWRKPEPYKGKGIKFAGEVIARKEAKKK